MNFFTVASFMSRSGPSVASGADLRFVASLFAINSLRRPDLSPRPSRTFPSAPLPCAFAGAAAFAARFLSAPLADSLAAAGFADGVFDATGLTAAAFTGAALPFTAVFTGSGAFALGGGAFGESFFTAAFAALGFAAGLWRPASFDAVALNAAFWGAALAGMGRFALFFTSVFRTFQLHCSTHPAQ